MSRPPAKKSSLNPPQILALCNPLARNDIPFRTRAAIRPRPFAGLGFNWTPGPDPLLFVSILAIR